MANVIDITGGSNRERSERNYKYFRSVIDEYLSNGADLDDTLNAICTPIENYYQSEDEIDDDVNPLHPIWGVVVSTARSTDFESPSRQKLADLMVGLASRPTVERDGQPVTVEDMTVWQDLPTFGWTMRDAWNFNSSVHTSQEERDKWLNLNAWTCSLVVAGQSDSLARLASFDLFGLWTIRTGLEEDQSPAEIDVAAAATWLVYGAPTLWQLSQQKRQFGRSAAPGALFKDHQEWIGFNVDRWNVWAQRLAELQSSMSHDRAAQLVWQARDAMSAGSAANSDDTS